MSDSEDSDAFDNRSFAEVSEEIERCKRNPETSGMFVSGWDEADQDVDLVKDPKYILSLEKYVAPKSIPFFGFWRSTVTYPAYCSNPIDHVLWAAENGEVDTLKQILATQPGLVHAQDSDGYTPLHRAAYSNHVEAISYLLSAGAKVTTRTQMGWTPLHSACNWNNYLAAARLLAAGADPAALSDGEQTPLHLASAISHCKSTLLILLLREDTADIARKRNNSGETPTELAQRHGIYGPLFEMALPAASYIRSLAFTSNPYVRMA